jgi:hypothetical protein
MAIAELELITTNDLIQELFNRKTLAGVIIYSPHNHRCDGQRHEEFMLLSTADDDSTLFMLKKGIESIENRVMEDGS